MQQVVVKFEDVDQVRDFVNTVSTVEANFELGSGRRIVDAKSILGVLSLDLRQVLSVRAHGADEAFEQYLDTLSVAEGLIA